MAKVFKNNFLLMLVVGFSFMNGLGAFASDNVLQAIEVDGVQDSYNIILRSDDSAELQKTVQAPNKMILTLKGIRASKSINTIYNNTANVDSVVVEPMGGDGVKILIQANNVSHANVQFDTLKTPLNVLDKPGKGKNNGEIVLSPPVEAYRPVYDNSLEQDEEGSGISDLLTSTTAHYIKKALKNEKLSWVITIGLFSIMLLSGIKAIKGKDSEIKVGLSQSLKERELDLYRSSGLSQLQESVARANNAPSNNPIQPSSPPLSGINYGLKAYQNGTKSPYLSSEIQRGRPAVAPPRPNFEQLQKAQVAAQANIQNNIQKAALNTTAQGATRPKPSNIDSMKFLESMTKIYEKNGRTDLAQGLKTNMKKAKINLA